MKKRKKKIMKKTMKKKKRRVKREVAKVRIIQKGRVPEQKLLTRFSLSK